MNRSIGHPVHILSPGPIGQITGGFIFLNRIAQGLRDRGEQVMVHELRGHHPFADEETRLEADGVISRIPDGAVVLVDGLAIPATAHGLWLDRHRLRVAALVHHPLHTETGLDPVRAAALHRIEAGALAGMRRVLVPSRATAEGVRALGVPQSRIAVTPPGTVKGQAAEPETPPHLLCLATLTPRKGQTTLVAALARLAHRPWTATLAGSLLRDADYAGRVRAAVDAHGLSHRIALPGEVTAEALESLWRRTALFVLPSHHEGYGMAAAEALARGIPVIAGDSGAQGEVVPADAGAVVPPGDADALAAALDRLLSDTAALASARGAARAAGAALPDWPASLDRIRSELARIVAADDRIERIA
ncbi:MAG: hypothetical protein RLY86_1083 [Pseudomonadota bacterium]|jgi:glycosyltransferase involved in cell wall biosynthesis